MNSKLIVLSGNIGSGKDTVANCLSDYFYIKVSFAEKLKDLLAFLFDWNRELLEGITPESREWREKKDEEWDITPREAMNLVGSRLFRDNFREDVWVKFTEKRVKELLKRGKEVVITDCRFVNEAEMLKRLGGVFIYVKRGDKDPEYEMSKIQYDYVIENDTTKEELIKKLYKIFGEITKTQIIYKLIYKN
jgi:hypothetical protein